MAKVQFSIRVEAEEKARLEEIAKARGVTLVEAVRAACELWAGFDITFLEHLQEQASKMGVSTSVYIQNRLAKL